MTSSRTRIGVLGVLLGTGFVVVLFHLWLVMVRDAEVWARRSYENRSAFRSVPSQRGALRDRLGRVLAHDEPTTRVAVYYKRFRHYHVVGAALHGAMHWLDLQPGLSGNIYGGYADGPLGPRLAVREFLAVPVGVLRRGALPKANAEELWMYATTVLSVCSGWSRRLCYRALREAADAGYVLGIGDVLPMPRSELLAAFEQRLEALYELDRQLAGEQRLRAQRLDVPADEALGLVATLDALRWASVEKERVKWNSELGSLLEDVRRYFAEEVSFGLAAALRVGRDTQPGIDVEPAVMRVLSEASGTSLHVLVGSVVGIDRIAMPDTGDASAPKTWLQRRVEAELPDDLLDEFVPEGLMASDEVRLDLREQARQRYERALLTRERRGITGLEFAFDEQLMGRLGMRFVEHDSKRKEQLLWSHLHVESGEDVQVTIDVDLQHAAEAAAEVVRSDLARLPDDKYSHRLEAAIAVLDARTGDLLAYAGSPIVSAASRDVPGVVWTWNGAIGSVVKPFVLVEQLESERLGLPHLPMAQIEPCGTEYRYGSTPLRCKRSHWSDGNHPVHALAKSCNEFFFRVGEGLGDAGLARALGRFGLFEPDTGDELWAACWQPDIRGLAAAEPRVDKMQIVPRRAIGYGIEASPVSIARAYAGLATGSLPTVGLRMGERRPLVPLGDIEASLTVVREGLRECVTSGSAENVPLLAELGVMGKTGTAELDVQTGHNNAWFAGYLPSPSVAGVQLCFAAVVYYVPDEVHGADAAGLIVSRFLGSVSAAPRLAADYLPPGSGR